MNVVIYARDSDSKQAEKGLSIPGQLRVVHESCEESGDIVLREFIDDGFSGTTDKRPAFQEMMRYCKANADAIDAVLVWKFNRFARDRVDSPVYKRYLKKLGIKVISNTEPISDGIDSDVLEGVIEIMDSRFSKSLAQDVMRGISEVAKRGFYPFGLPPFGYKKEEIRDGRAKRYQLTPEPGTSPLVRRIFKLYTTEGLGGKAIAEKLNDEGLRTSKGCRWSAKAILYILGNPVYAGTLTVKYKTENAEYLAEKDREVIIENAHESLIERETFDRAQTIRAQRKQATPNALASQYLLSGLLRCKRCGRKLYGASAKSGEYHYYVCRGYVDSGKAT
ncbi:recombinase family protein, partial [Candidatus Bipolaricaulota bacterium]